MKMNDCQGRAFGGGAIESCARERTDAQQALLRHRTIGYPSEMIPHA